ncbi:hypothetical protein FOE78_20005 [Microlunatus elymi]|uniref:Uncharacterized protein n=1 Tax=Microlunatus elymi TaxID=2596828 RepID=A0A516Q378_9ACTN|nr:hypothetical protein [Microlunatus elymi]QDP97883.1 hypothetical protein FOE78_20005 [Microlunatus elymi]
MSGSIRYHGRSRIIFAAIGLALVAIMVIACIGMATTIPYNAQGTTQVMHLSNMAVFWLWLALMDIPAILAYLISWAYRA